MINITKMIWRLLPCFAAAFLTVTLRAAAETPKDDPVCVVYVTGIGCGNCAVTDPVLFVNATAASPNLIVFEYEIYRSLKDNQNIKDLYFASYLAGKRPGVPCLIMGPGKFELGRVNVQKGIELLDQSVPLGFPNGDGTMISFADLDLTRLPGSVKIWTKNRVLISGEGGNNNVIKRLLLEDDLPEIVRDVKFERVDPEPVLISHSQVDFDHAVRIGNWRLQWNGEPLAVQPEAAGSMDRYMSVMVLALLVLTIAFSFFRVRKTRKGAPLTFEFRGRTRDFVIAIVSLLALTVFFVSAKHVSPDFLEDTGYRMPLPLFTFLIAFVDGFNPCNMFVLTCLLALLISASDSRKRLYAVSLSFVGMVYVFYFLFMALWLNVFKYISFIAPLRIGIAMIAIGAGLINCKELFFFKKGISLTIQDKHKGPLMMRIQSMKEIIRKGSFPLLITSSVGMATLASLVELPCTAGFPIIYTGILSGKGLANTASYYFYLMYYNAVYVLPLLVIVSIFVYTLKARHITQRQMEIIKYIGGVIMLLLGIALLVNPGLLGLGIG